MSEFKKCLCNVCSQPIEFEAEHAGETVQCPHCGCDTILFIVPAPPAPVVPKKQSTQLIAQMVPVEIAERIVKNNAEDRRERWGRIVNKGSLIGVGCLLQVLSIGVLAIGFFNPVFWLIAAVLFVAGMVKARKPCCADCGTHLNFRSVRVCPGCGVRFK